MKGLVLSSPLSLLVSFALFGLMAALIKSDNISLPPEVHYAPIEINTTPPQSSHNEISRSLPEQPDVQPSPPTGFEETTNTSGDDLITIETPSTIIDDNIAIDMSERNSDSGPRPIVQISPKYPADAVRDGVEGWVILSFTITEIGGVSDITILDSEPKGAFERSAKRALSLWKFVPQMEQGKAIKQPNQKVQLDFKLEE